ncbi:MAG: hypothetical protein ACKOTA_04555 [Solirubrobacterales bacterium]
MPALVKPEFGPSLPELAGPRLRALPRWVLWAAVAASALLVVLAVAGWMVVRTPTRTIEVKSPVAFSVTYPSESLNRLPASGAEVVRLASPAGTPNPVELEFSKVELPAGLAPTEGQREAAFPLVSQRLIEQMRREDPSFVVRGEQAVNYGGQAGFQIYYQTERDGKTWYGRRVLLFSDNLEDNVGVDVNAQALRPDKGSPMTVWEVAQADPLLRTLRSVKLASR